MKYSLVRGHSIKEMLTKIYTRIEELERKELSIAVKINKLKYE